MYQSWVKARRFGKEVGCGEGHSCRLDFKHVTQPKGPNIPNESIQAVFCVIILPVIATFISFGACLQRFFLQQ
jgi:hypothetical protein